MLYPSTKDSSNGALHDVSPFPSWGRIVYVRRCPSFLRMHDNQLSPRSSPSTKCSLNQALDHDVNSPLTSRGPVRRSYHDVHSLFTSHGPVRRSKLLTCFIELKGHHPAHLQHHTFLISSSSPPAFCIPVACLFFCLLSLAFVCLFALASSLSIEIYYFEYLPA